MNENHQKNVHEDPRDQESESSVAKLDIWTIQRVLQWSAGWLKDKSVDTHGIPRLDVELLLANVLKSDRMSLYMRLDLPLEKKERDEFKTLLRRRVEGEPIAYILGYRDFYRHRFEVSRSVLIPRPDTEILVEQALTAARGFNAPRILDIGTGSGCVAISLAAELPEATVEAWDISDEALAVARTNMDAIGVANLTLLPRDALAPDAFRCQQFDVIVSNPPYVARHEVGLMSHETRAYEPEMALFSPDGYGLAFYRCFAERCQEALPPGGKICLEIGLNQAEEVAQLFNAANWRKIEVIKDLAGHDRVICAERA